MSTTFHFLRTLAVLGALAALGSPGAAAPASAPVPTPAPDRTYPLADYLDIVMARSPGVLSAILQAKAADYKAKAIRASYFPKLTAQGQTGYVKGSGLSPLEDFVNNQTPVHGFVDAGGGRLDFPLYAEGTFLGINTPPKAEIFYAIKSEADNQAILTRDDIRFDAIKDYLLAVQETKKGKLLGEEVHLLNQEARIAEIEYNHKLISREEFDNSRIQLQQAQQDFEESQWQAAHCFSVVASLLGVDDPTRIHLPAKQPLPPALPSFDVVLTHVLESNPALLKQFAALQAAKAQHTFDLTKFGPTATIDNSYFWANDYNPPGHDQWLSRVQVSLPLFDGGENYYNVRAASEQVDAEKELLYQTKLTLESDLHDVYNGTQDLRRAYLQNEITLGQKRIAMQQQEVLSHYGQALMPQFLTAQLDYIAAVMATEDSYYAMMMAYAQFDKAGAYAGATFLVGAH